MGRYLGIIPVLLFSGCAGASTYEIEPYRTACVSEGLGGCLVGREDGTTELRPIYGGIDGFSFEWGYTYRLELTQTASAAQDGATTLHLERVVSKTALPPGSRFLVQAAASDRAGSWALIAQGSCAAGYRLYGEKDLAFDTPAACASFAQTIAASPPGAIEVEVTVPTEPLRFVGVSP